LLQTKNVYLFDPVPRSSVGIVIGGFQVETGSASSLSSSSWRKIEKNLQVINLTFLFFFFLFIWIIFFVFEIICAISEASLSYNIVCFCSLKVSIG